MSNVRQGINVLKYSYFHYPYHKIEDTTVTVIEKTEDGWWLVTSDAGKTQGWISAAFLNTKNAREDAPESVDVDNEKYVVSGSIRIGKNNPNLLKKILSQKLMSRKMKTSSQSLKAKTLK